MPPFFNSLLIVAIFLLRFGVPLVVMLALGFFLRRLDARWEAEARSQRAAGKGSGTGAATEHASPPTAVLPPSAMSALGASCWKIKGSDPKSMLRWPASHAPYVFCWQARRQIEGRIPIECYHCDLYLTIHSGDSSLITPQSHQQVYDARTEVQKTNP